MKRHALFVGVNDYADNAFKNLRHSLSDAIALSLAFGRRGFETDILSNPKSEEILDAVERISAGLGPGDVFLFFFAGHGFTAPDGSHLLICAGDKLSFLRHNRAGIPVDLLEEVTNGGGFHRAFLLDACRTDVFAGVENRGAETRDLALVSLPDAKANAGTCCVLRSCDRFCPAMEFEDLGHGVFTRAVMDVLGDDSACAIPFGETFVSGIRSRMRGILAAHGVPTDQNPCFQTNGEAFFLFDVPTAVSPRPHSIAPVVAPALVVCPVCGKKNDPKDTFKCRVCGRDDLCLEHRDRTTFLCDDCEKSRKAKEGMDWFQKGEDFLNGSNGCRQDHDEAVKCYRKAAELGNRSACHKYGDLLFNGRMGVEKNIQNALEYYLQADANDAWVQYNVGSCYLHFYQETKNGEDGKRAVMWLRKSADAGIPWACVKMGDCYRDGIGVGQDFVQAASWYRRAREQNPENENGAFQWAEWCLGNLYRNGQGVERDLDEALNWFRKAAVRKQEAATCSEAAAAEVEAEQKAKEESSRQAWEESWCNAWEKTKCISQEGVVSNVKEETGRKEKEATSRMVKREVERKSDPKPNGRYQEIANGLTWSFEVNNEKATIGSFSSCTFAIPKDSEGSITIPSALGGCLVTAIGDNAFKGCQGLTSVTIPESVTTIGKEAFGFCKRLTSMTIPRAVTSIGYSAFVYCDALASVTILSRKLMLETNPFNGCRNLTTWILPGGDFPFVSQGVFLLSKDGKTLLAGPAAKGDVTIPYGVTRIGESAFSFCERLTSVTIPRSVTKIDRHAFSFCDGLASVTIPRSVTSIGYASFGHCRSLSLLTKMRLKARARECL